LLQSLLVSAGVCNQGMMDAQAIQQRECWTLLQHIRKSACRAGS